MRPRGAGAPYPPQKVRNSETSETMRPERPASYGFSASAQFLGLRLHVRNRNHEVRNQDGRRHSGVAVAMCGARSAAGVSDVRGVVSDWFRVNPKAGASRNLNKNRLFRYFGFFGFGVSEFLEGVSGLLTFNPRSRGGGHRDAF